MFCQIDDIVIVVVVIDDFVYCKVDLFEEFGQFDCCVFVYVVYVIECVQFFVLFVNIVRDGVCFIVCQQVVDFLE